MVTNPLIDNNQDSISVPIIVSSFVIYISVSIIVLDLFKVFMKLWCAITLEAKKHLNKQKNLRFYLVCFLNVPKVWLLRTENIIQSIVLIFAPNNFRVIQPIILHIHFLHLRRSGLGLLEHFLLPGFMTFFSC